MPAARRRERITEVIGKIHLEKVMHQRIETLSINIERLEASFGAGKIDPALPIHLREVACGAKQAICDARSCAA